MLLERFLFSTPFLPHNIWSTFLRVGCDEGLRLRCALAGAAVHSPFIRYHLVQAFL